MSNPDPFDHQADIEMKLNELSIKYDKPWLGTFSELVWIQALAEDGGPGLVLRLVVYGLHSYQDRFKAFNRLSHAIRRCCTEGYDLTQDGDNVRVRYFVFGGSDPEIEIVNGATVDDFRPFCNKLRDPVNELIRSDDMEHQHLT